jgi:hypothetical protein
MAGASDPGVAAALEAQSKAIDVQSRTMATQSKLLQQLCDRFEHQDQRWSSIEKVVDQNAVNIANLQGRLNEEELTRVLGERLDGQLAEFQQDQAYRVQELVANTSTRVAVLENVSSVFEAWRPRIEGSIDSVRSSVDTMRSELARLTQLLEGGIAGEHQARPSLLGAYVPVAERPSTTTATHNSDWANGHRNACQPREYGIENSQIPIHLPNNGMHSPYIPQTQDTRPNRTSWDNHPYTSDAMGGSVQDPNFARNLGNLPKLHFPSFDGGNPKLWQTRCEDYFLMYSVDPRMWIKVASMQFVGPAAIWLQSIEYKLVQMSWGEFGRLIQERFGKDQYQGLLRQLFQIRQTGTVATYVEEFSRLIDKLNAYQTMSDPLYYTLKFVDGLRDDIKAVVMLQRPQDFDTAAVIAQLQEEAGLMLRKKDYRWHEVSGAAKSSTRQPAYQQLVSKETRQHGPNKVDEKPSGTRVSSSTDDRIASLYAYRKAKGLCYKCGLQYSRDHRCSETVQLHVVEELWQMA